MVDRKNSKKEEENLWNALLVEALTGNKFFNSNILLLGDKNSGKRSLLNAIQDISETEFPNKSSFLYIFLKSSQENESSKLGLKAAASVLEYTYVDVKNLNDRDNGRIQKKNSKFKQHLKIRYYGQTKHLSDGRFQTKVNKLKIT